MISELLAKFAKKRIFVLGDVMLDHYVWGRVERISPEAPVPVMEAHSEEYRPGGAANVALNVSSLGAQTLLAGIVGADSPAKTLRDLLNARGVDPSALIVDPQRSTTLKTRIGAGNQQIVRIDYESREELSVELSRRLLAKLEETLPSCHALIIEDYNKGVLTAEVISGALELARRHGIPVAVDPKQRHFNAYLGAEIFKPNYRELIAVLDREPHNEDEFFAAAAALQRNLRLANLIVTRGANGMYIFEGSAKPRHLPTYAREVYDVSGAGDTVIAALTLAWVCSGDIQLAAEVANHAAGVVCGINGTASVTPEALLASFNEPR